MWFQADRPERVAPVTRGSAGIGRPPPQTKSIRPLLVALGCLIVAIGVLLDRTWRFGEVFSPADAIFQFYPWAYDAPHTTPSNLSRTDEAFFHQPLVQTHWARLTTGDWPDLDPLVLSGVPGFAQGLAVGQAFSPLSLPFYFASPALAVTLYAALRLICAGLFMFLFLRARQCSTGAATAGGLAFALNGAFITWLSAPIPTIALWLPLAWMYVDRVYDRRRLCDAAMLAIVLACIWLGAYPPTSLACAAAVAAYAGARTLETGAWRAVALSIAAAATSLLIASVGLVPMLANLLDSPAAGRAMAASHADLDVLATFVLPDFFGNPVHQNWWRPGAVSYPELVSYVGVVSLVLAGSGVLARRPDESSWRRWFFAGLAVAALGVMYGWPPSSWIMRLPGFRQTNPMRWSVVLAASIAVLTAYGVDWLGRRSPGGRRPFMGAVVVAAGLTALAGAVLISYRPTIRALGIQDLEWQQLSRFALLTLGSLALVSARLLIGERRAESRLLFPSVLAWSAAGLVVVDLVSFGRGFNPTLSPERLYPSTPALEFLAHEAGDGRIAPAGPDSVLLQGHVFSVYGLPTVVGFDFRGDASYQRFIARVDGGRAFAGPQWNHVLLVSPERLNLRLLGLLSAGLVVTAPVDAPPRAGRYAPLPELVEGRLVRQDFVARQDNLRRIDVLTATHRRANKGTLTVRLVTDAGDLVAERTVTADQVRDNDWLTLDFKPIATSKGQRFGIELAGHGARAGAAVTAWAVQRVDEPSEPLLIDGRATAQVLWYRAFSANERLGDARLVYARDLNIYRNPYARPRAWFVPTIEILPSNMHLDRLVDMRFDSERQALVDQPLRIAPTATARVRSIDLSHPDHREIVVDAPDGGVLIVGERAAPGWTAFVDNRPAPLVRSNAVLMAVAVPAGSQRVVLKFEHPTVRGAALVSAFVLAMALAAARARASR